jgi:hypothetical protein
LKDAADMMYVGYKDPNNEIDKLDNSNDPFLTEVQVLDKGRLRYREYKYFRKCFLSLKGIVVAIFGAGGVWFLIKGLSSLLCRVIK